MLLEPLRFPEPDRLVMVHDRNLKAGFPQFSLSPGNYLDFRDHNHTLAGFAALMQQGLNLSGGSAPERLHGAQSTANLFTVMGVNPVMGRGLTEEDLKPGKKHVAILSDGLWARRFARKNVLGQTLRLNHEIYTIVGVMPRGFTFPESTEIWAPLSLDEKEWRQRGGHYLTGIARLKAGATVQAAEADLNSIAARAAM